MGFELIDQDATDLVEKTKELLEVLADAWDPDAGATAEVRNDTLEKASKLNDRWRQLRWK